MNGYNYQAIMVQHKTTNNNKFSLTPKIQEKYLNLSQLFVYQRVANWIQETLLPLIQTHIGPIELDQSLSMVQIQELFSKIQRNLKFEQKIGEFLLCIDELDWSSLEPEENSMLKTLIADTLDILETPDFLTALTSTISSGFNFILDQIVEHFQPNELLRQEAEMKMAKIIPKLDKITKNQSEFLFQSVQNTDSCSTLMANVFETFCIPLK